MNILTWSLKEQYSRANPAQMSDKAKDLISDIILVAAKHGRYDPKKFDRPEITDDWTAWMLDVLWDAIADACGVPEYGNPSGRDDYGGFGDYCRDYIMDAIYGNNESPGVQTKEEALVLIEQLVGESRYNALIYGDSGPALLQKLRDELDDEENPRTGP